MMYQTSIQSIFRNQRLLLEMEEQVATQKKITKVSDDPHGMMKILSYQETLSKLDRYQSNMTSANMWLTTTNTVLEELSNILSEAKSLAMQEADNCGDGGDGHAGGIQLIEGYINGVIQIGNTSVGSQYIFGGSVTQTKPFNDDGTYNGDSHVLSAEVGSGVYQAYNIPGSEFLTVDLDPDLGAPLSSSGLTVQLSDLNGGDGVQLGEGLAITDRAGNYTWIDTSGATTLQDIIDAININTNVTASLNEAGSGIQLVDNNPSDQQVQPLRVYDTNTARDLGLFTEDSSMTITKSNNKVYFEDGGVLYSAILASGTYNGNEMVAELKRSLEAAVDASGNSTNKTFDVSFDSTDKKLSIDPSAAVDFQWVSGGVDGQGSSAASVLGFTADDSGTGPFVADQVAGTEGRNGKIVGTDLDPRVTGSTDINLLYGGNGVQLGSIKIANGTDTAVIDLSGAATVQDVIDLINGSGTNVTAQVNSTGTALEISSTVAGSVPVVTDEDASESASALGLQSGGDIIGILKDFQQALIDDDEEAINNVLINLQAAYGRVAEIAATNASRSLNVEEMETFADNLTLQTQNLLSEVEDVDITEAVAKLLQQQTTFETVLAAASKVMQMSLLDYL